MSLNKDIDLSWSDQYALNVDSIDKAHKEIFQITALLLEKNLAENREAVAESIEFLKQYVINHFMDEERYMRDAGFPGLKDHAVEHAHFRDVVVPGIENKLIASEYSKETVNEFIQILVDWLTSHIMIHDKMINSTGIR